MKHERENSRVYLMDCMELMAQYPDRHFDLAVVDPPYGIDASKFGNGSRNKKYDRSENKAWDSQPPTLQYWQQLFRVSKNQIIFGMNYYTLPPIQHFIVWDKKQPDGVTFAQAELVWTSFKGTSKITRLTSNGQESRIHPTQKPVALYDWIFMNYAKPDQKILDTHLGSQSSRIAAHKHGLDFTGCELDAEYFEQGCKRFDQYLLQPTLFSLT